MVRENNNFNKNTMMIIYSLKNCKNPKSNTEIAEMLGFEENVYEYELDKCISNGLYKAIGNCVSFINKNCGGLATQ